MQLLRRLSYTALGLAFAQVEPRMAVQVRRYRRPLKLLHPAGHSYYRMLREKLNWNRD